MLDERTSCGSMLMGAEFSDSSTDAGAGGGNFIVTVLRVKSANSAIIRSFIASITSASYSFE